MLNKYKFYLYNKSFTVIFVIINYCKFSSTFTNVIKHSFMNIIYYINING
jgi:hypothetical protein